MDAEVGIVDHNTGSEFEASGRTGHHTHSLTELLRVPDKLEPGLRDPLRHLNASRRQTTDDVLEQLVGIEYCLAGGDVAQ